MDEPVVEGEIVGLAGWEGLIEKTRRRAQSNRALNGRYMRVAESFSQKLVASCPFVQSIALAGSLASGGFEDGDDIDFDLFVDSGTKYTAYLFSILIGIGYAWRHRNRHLSELHRTPLLPKITCINVVWSEDQTHPFLRQDDALAFELMRCQPLYGVEHFSRVLASNRWITSHFPQIFDKVFEEKIAPTRNPLGRFLETLGRHDRLLRLLEAVSKRISWVIYSLVQSRRKRNPRAAARIAYLRKVKRPYEVFQD